MNAFLRLGSSIANCSFVATPPFIDLSMGSTRYLCAWTKNDALSASFATNGMPTNSCPFRLEGLAYKLAKPELTRASLSNSRSSMIDFTRRLSQATLLCGASKRLISSRRMFSFSVAQKPTYNGNSKFRHFAMLDTNESVLSYVADIISATRQGGEISHFTGSQHF